MNAATPKDAIWRPHVTVATVVERDGRFLLVEEWVNGALVLNQPAGHLEDGESLFAAARRETLEETAWEVELVALLGIHQWTRPGLGQSFLRFTFAARPLRHDPARGLDADIVRALWLTRTEIAAEAGRLRSPMIERSTDAWLAGRRIALDVIESLLPNAAVDPTCDA